MTDARPFLKDVPTAGFIAGEWVQGEATFPVESPATEETLAYVADIVPEQAVAALAAASAAQPSWAITPGRERAELLRRVFEWVMAREEVFAATICAEMGKPLAEARGEVRYGAEFLRWFSDLACHTDGRSTTSPEGTLRIHTRQMPVGVCLAVTPWNFPLAMATRKLAPALAAGCSILLKPSELAPLTSLLFVRALQECGVPEGVVSCIPTSDPGPLVAAVMADRRLRKITFTGSTAVGKHLCAQAAPRLLRTSMELGGNAPFIVLPHADLDEAIEAAVVAKMRNIGQACTSANRFLVHHAVAEEFAQRLAGRLSCLRVGDPFDPATDVGPLITARARRDALARVEESAHGGAVVMTGGAAVGERGHFLAPTVVMNAAHRDRLMTEENFSPVAPIQVFSTTDQAVAMANDTDAGLIAYVMGTHLRDTTRVAEALDYGMVAINTGVISNAAAPFGGVKQSGLGREGGHEGLREFTEIQYLGQPL